MFLNKNVQKMYEDMRDKLTQDVFNKVGKILLDQSKQQQAEISEQLTQRLQDWDNTIKERVKDIIKEQQDNEK